MRVTWLNTDPQFASARLRSIIPRDTLYALNMLGPGHDIVIAAKHGWNPLTVREHATKMVMDVCDDHFDGPLASHYRLACGIADAVTCNSEPMQAIIHEHTGRTAHVIDDPYEDPELEPTGGDGVLWFGHSSNMPDLEAVADQIKYPLMVINSLNYSTEALARALKACRCTIIPTGKKQAKSANRAIRSIRYGKFPVCGPMPAHEELGLGLDSLGLALDEAMSGDMSVRVRYLQDAIRDRFCPDRVAKEWHRVLQSL